MDYDNFCKKCQHYDFNLQKGILCRITNAKPDFDQVCMQFQLDPNREAEIQKSKDLKEIRNKQVPVEMDERLKKWGIGLIILGVIHILASQFLDPVWGGIIIILGILNLVIKKRGMFVANGIALLLVGLLNILSGFLDDPVNFFWGVFGIVQLIWGIQEIRKYKLYDNDQKTENDKSIGKSQTTSWPVTETFPKKHKHSGFGIASFSIASIALIVLVLLFITSVYLNIVNPDGIDEESPEAILLGLIMILDLFMVLIGTGLGIAGVVGNGKKKVFSVLGLVFNGVFLILLVLAFIPE
jgi:hypothetical protein